jgi:hypothetical protein
MGPPHPVVVKDKTQTQTNKILLVVIPIRNSQQPDSSSLARLPLTLPVPPYSHLAYYCSLSYGLVLSTTVEEAPGVGLSVACTARLLRYTSQASPPIQQPLPQPLLYGRRRLRRIPSQSRCARLDVPWAVLSARRQHEMDPGSSGSMRSRQQRAARRLQARTLPSCSLGRAAARGGGVCALAGSVLGGSAAALAWGGS